MNLEVEVLKQLIEEEHLRLEQRGPQKSVPLRKKRGGDPLKGPPKKLDTPSGWSVFRHVFTAAKLLTTSRFSVGKSPVDCSVAQNGETTVARAVKRVVGGLRTDLLRFPLTSFPRGLVLAVALCPSCLFGVLARGSGCTQSQKKLSGAYGQVTW